MYDSSVTVNASSVDSADSSVGSADSYVDSTNSSVNSANSSGNCANTSVDGANSSINYANSSVDGANCFGNCANSSVNCANSFLLDPKPPACHNAFHNSMASGRAGSLGSFNFGYKAACLAQTRGFVTSRKLITRSCFTCVWILRSAALAQDDKKYYSNLKDCAA